MRDESRRPKQVPESGINADERLVNCTHPWHHVALWPNSSAMQEERVAVDAHGAREVESMLSLRARFLAQGDGDRFYDHRWVGTSHTPLRCGG